MKIDTSIDGFKHIGINLTEKQYDDLCCLNILMNDEDRKNIPVFNIILVLKALNLIPSEMINNDTCNYADNYGNNDFNQILQKKFGKFSEK